MAFAFLLSNFAEEVGWTEFLFDRLQAAIGRSEPPPLSRTRSPCSTFPDFIVETGSLIDGLVLLGVLFIPQLASRVIVAWFYNTFPGDRPLWIRSRKAF